MSVAKQFGYYLLSTAAIVLPLCCYCGYCELKTLSELPASLVTREGLNLQSIAKGFLEILWILGGFL